MAQLFTDTTIDLLRRLNQENLGAGTGPGGADLVLNRDGVELPAQSVRLVWETLTPADPRGPVLVDVPTLACRIIGDTDLDIATGDTFAIDGRLFVVVAPKTPEPAGSRQYRREAWGLART